jgi:hypothetical protein
MVVFDAKPRVLNPVDHEASRIVELFALCQNLQCLPKAGGLLDQDAYTVETFKLVLQAQAIRHRLEEKRAKEEANRAARR